jgi:uncharacterized protein YkwD
MRLRATALAAAALVLFVVLGAGSALAASLTKTETRLLAAVNQARAAHGLRPLRLDWTLESAARQHSADMMHSNSFGHGNFFARLHTFGASGPVLGENIAWGAGRDGSAAAIVGEWLASPMHRANLLRPGFRRIGIGAIGGRFAGMRSAVVVTADFGGR